MAEVTLSGLLSSLKSGVDPEVIELLHQEVHTIISGEDGGAEKTTVGFLKSFPGLRYFEGHLQIEQAADLTWLLSGHLELGSLELEISPGVVGLEEQLAPFLEKVVVRSIILPRWPGLKVSRKGVCHLFDNYPLSQLGLRWLAKVPRVWKLRLENLEDQEFISDLPDSIQLLEPGRWCSWWLAKPNWPLGVAGQEITMLPPPSFPLELIHPNWVRLNLGFSLEAAIQLLLLAQTARRPILELGISPKPDELQLFPTFLALVKKGAVLKLRLYSSDPEVRQLLLPAIKPYLLA